MYRAIYPILKVKKNKIGYYSFSAPTRKRTWKSKRDLNSQSEYSYHSILSNSDRKRRRRGIYNECCEKPCTEEHLRLYCASDSTWKWVGGLLQQEKKLETRVKCICCIPNWQEIKFWRRFFYTYVILFAD